MGDLISQFRRIPVFDGDCRGVQMEIGVDEEGDPIYQEETAWGDGLAFEGRNWATYFEYEDP